MMKQKKTVIPYLNNGSIVCYCALSEKEYDGQLIIWKEPVVFNDTLRLESYHRYYDYASLISVVTCFNYIMEGYIFISIIENGMFREKTTGILDQSGFFIYGTFIPYRGKKGQTYIKPV